MIIFDEIQECNKALNALKYFCEDAPEYAVVAAGSLLGVALSKGNSFPVGKVEFMEVLPRYCTSIGKAEVDFVIQLGLDIIPVEVKSENRLGGKSLSVYDASYSPDYKIRYSLNNLKMDNNLINIPLYLADWTAKLISTR